jgi:hypothetical protein
MTDIKTTVRNLLISNATLTALVPSGRITLWHQNVLNTLPCITFNEVDNYNLDEDIADDLPYADHFIIQIDVWVAPGASTLAIASAVNAVMEANYWNREASEDMIEEGTKIQRKLLRYTTRMLR